MFNERYAPADFSPTGERWLVRQWERADFDPISATAIGLAVAGGATSAMGTLAGGSAAKQAGLAQQQADEFKAKQAEQNAGLAIASSQVRMRDTQLKTGLAESTSTARSAASGVDAGVGSADTNVGDIAKRGGYLASMDLYNGEVTASGLLNEAKGYRYSGEVAKEGGEAAQTGSYLAAGGQFLSSAGGAYKLYGNPKLS